MPLSAGTKLGPYEIVSLLGKGGMGEVYRAHDSRLGRDVAVKVCAEQFSERFEREARAVAALNHPNVCQLYDVGSNFLVMELIDGESPKGPLPLDEALRIARQIASALDAAHSKGIVHRDLKPANIKIKPDGTVKVLDFGLAKTAEAPAGDPENSPTMTVSPTRAGMIMGTAAYMSPEQARGKIVDKRSDIWSFGVVLYELLAGARPFHGEDLTEILASVVKDAPDLSKAPAKVRRLLGSCLEKDPEKRLRDIGDVGLLLEEPAVAAKGVRVWPWVAAAVLGVALGVVGWTRPGAKDAPPLTLDIVPPPGMTLRAVSNVGSTPEVAPDGSAVMFSLNRGCYVRRLDSLESKLVPGCEEQSNPGFWSADSTTVVYPSISRQVRKVRLPDGAPQVLAMMTTSLAGGSWSDGGSIIVPSVHSSGLRLETVPVAGGALKPLELPDGLRDGSFEHPEFLAGSEEFLFFHSSAEDPSDGSTYLATLHDGKVVNPALLLKNPTPARYTAAGGGRILFVRNDNLYSQRLNRHTRRLEGEAELVVQRVASNFWGNFSVAQNGTIAWRAGRSSAALATEFDRSGNMIGASGANVMATSLHLSPDERQLLATGELSGSWLMDIGQTGLIDLSKSGHWFGWFAGGSKLVGTRRDGALIEMPASGAGEVRQIRNLGGDWNPWSVYRDGKSIAGTNHGAQGLVYAPIEGTPDETKPRELVKGGTHPTPSFSPDGRWILYGISGPGGGLYVQPFPGPGARRQISSDNSYAVWRGDSKEILYISRTPEALTLMSIAVGGGATPSFSAPQKMFSGLRWPGGSITTTPLAVSRDGSRIFWLQAVEQPEPNVIHVKIGAVR